MGYKRRPVYQFDSENDIGLDDVPTGGMVVVKKADGTLEQFVKTSDDNILPGTTIAEAMDLATPVISGIASKEVLDTTVATLSNEVNTTVTELETNVNTTITEVTTSVDTQMVQLTSNVDAAGQKAVAMAIVLG